MPGQVALRGLADELGLDVDWLDPTTRTALAMSRADVLLCPSWTVSNGDQEGTPTVICEAGASGLAIISTRHAGIPEQIDDGRSGLLSDERDAPLEGRFPYDCFKSCTHLITTSYHGSFGLPVCITRCGNLFGPGDLNRNRIVPGRIGSALRGETPVIRSEGSFVRDDLTLAEEMGRAHIVRQALNFSNDKPLDVLSMVALALGACGKAGMGLDTRGEASNELQMQFLSSNKAQRLLAGWAPRFGLDEGLRA
ncbi:MAG: NAD-dependent epimerase/dehydratase family protein [Myxococcales bacterium]|nr:NAD-dependent epimerase/dehydratase family protein [Myxococcales bacterium]